MNRIWLRLCLAAGLAVGAGTACAADAAPTPAMSAADHLQLCLKRADDLPDMAAAEAAAWIKNGGGHDAHLCRAFAQANRGMHADAAREFWGLASAFDRHDAPRAMTMHRLSGQEFLQAGDAKNAEAQYAGVLKIAPNDVAALVGRAQCRMAVEKYWDALDDLNRAIKLSPDDADALRQRGRAWMRLDNPKNAQEDFERAAAMGGGGQDK